MLSGYTTGKVIFLKIDLHSHTTYSDGRLDVDQLLTRALNHQLDVLAITDHDCIDALPEAEEWLAKNNSKKKPLSLVGGVEISTKWHSFEIHILGLDIQFNNNQLRQRLNTQKQKRIERAKKICKKLESLGICDVFEEVDRLNEMVLEKGSISRAHIANVLVKRNIVCSFQQAFSKYLGKNKKAYVKPNWIDIDEAINWIHEANGKAVIAHPFHYDMTAKWLRRLTKEFASLGGDGMEVKHPNLDKKKSELMCSIANEHELTASAGSDFHGPSRWTELGRNLELPDTVVPTWSTFGSLAVKTR